MRSATNAAANFLKLGRARYHTLARFKTPSADSTAMPLAGLDNVGIKAMLFQAVVAVHKLKKQMDSQRLSDLSWTSRTACQMMIM